MIKNIYLGVFLFINLISNNTQAITPQKIDQPPYGLVNKICALSETEPILMSEVLKRAKERGISPRLAQQELAQERGLWIYARQQLKISVPEIQKAATEHIKKVMENNKMSREAFETALLKPPYSTTFQQYENEIAYFMLKNQVENMLASAIQISDKEIRERYNLDKLKDFQVLFISVLNNNKKLNRTTAINEQFKKANKIRTEFTDKKDVSHIKNTYKGQSDVSFYGPLDYREGILESKDEKQLKSNLEKNPRMLISDPFEDGEAVTMIVKIEKAASEDNEQTGLEIARNELYKEEIQRRLDAVMKNTLASVEFYCEW